jgi:rod shape-determining protein MreB and related proteins
MLKHFIQRANEGNNLVRPRIVIGIPSGVTEVERRAVMEAAQQAGASEVFLIDEPVAAAIGAGLPVAEPTGNMIIDIGGGTTEVAVLSLQGSVISDSVRVAGDELSDSIIQYMKKVHNLVIGERTAEEIKINVGSAYPTPNDDMNMEVRGLHMLSGLPRTVTIKAPEIRESMSEPLSVIVEAVKRTLERTPPELASDIIDRGIMLAGGGALLRGIDTLISHETGIVAHIADDPLTCVVKGTGLVLENFKQLERVFTAKSRTV